jgi:predicted nucleic acid-binding protein
VPEPPVVDASPFILLAKAGLLELLKLESESALVPDAVAQEIRTHEVDVAIKALEEADWIKIVPVPSVLGAIVAWDLGSGESAVLTWAHEHPGTVAIVDDAAARQCAQAWRIRTRGTLGLVLIAKQRGIFSHARPVLERLLQVGLYLDRDLMDRALALVGE